MYLRNKKIVAFGLGLMALGIFFHPVKWNAIAAALGVIIACIIAMYIVFNKPNMKPIFLEILKDWKTGLDLFKKQKSKGRKKRR